MSKPDLCVIFNPTAGKNRGQQRLERVRQTWGTHVDFRPTLHAGHAVELAEEAARQGFAVVAAAGGDGTAHEVLNGLMRVRDPNVHFAILPIGSANDYAYSLGFKGDVHASPRAVDVGLVRTEEGKSVYFGCCLGVGFNGFVTREARRIRRLQGVFLYGLAALRAVVHHYACPVTALQIDDEPEWQTPTLMLSVLVGKREGGFELAPQAQIDDGWLDFIHSADLSRWQVLQLLPRLALFGPPRDYPKVRQGRCRRVRICSDAPLIIHADGEFICVPEDGVRQVEIEVVPAAITVTHVA